MRTARKRGVTDMASEDVWMPHFPPIIRALLDVGLKLQEVHGTKDEEIIVVKEEA